MARIRVVVADDHAIIRDGVGALLALTGDIELAGEAATGAEAIQRVKELQPNIVLMDISMPVMDGLEATRHIHRECPRTKVLVLTQYEDRDWVFRMIDAGASGFISKVAASSELASAIRSVFLGDSYLSPSVAKFLVEDYQSKAGETSGSSYEQLTERERQVLKLVAEGHSTKKIADLLFVSPKTVEGHKTRLMAKLGLHDRVELVKYALRRRIITG
jgi:two-component system response regulator NreC